MVFVQLHLPVTGGLPDGHGVSLGDDGDDRDHFAQLIHVPGRGGFRRWKGFDGRQGHDRTSLSNMHRLRGMVKVQADNTASAARHSKSASPVARLPCLPEVDGAQAVRWQAVEAHVHTRVLHFTEILRPGE